MIAFLNGTVFSRTLSPSPACVVLDVGGVGYEVFVPLSTFDALPPEGAACRLLIHDYIREDARTLFGFLTSAEKELFLQLQSVSGVGPKLALSALSAMTVRALRDALIREDARLLARIPGIGKRTAERIIVELKGKINPLLAAAATPDAPAGAPADGGEAEPDFGQAFQDAVLGLVALGYSQESAVNAVRECARSASSANLTTPQIIHLVLSAAPDRRPVR